MPNTAPSQSTLIGKKVYPKDSSFYPSHVAFVKVYHGNGMYTISGGSLGSVEPLLHRSEFIVHRQKKEKS